MQINFIDLSWKEPNPLWLSASSWPLTYFWGNGQLSLISMLWPTLIPKAHHALCISSELFCHLHHQGFPAWPSLVFHPLSNMLASLLRCAWPVVLRFQQVCRSTFCHACLDERGCRSCRVLIPSVFDRECTLAGLPLRLDSIRSRKLLPVAHSLGSCW